jgi:hypothetical protein
MILKGIARTRFCLWRWAGGTPQTSGRRTAIGRVSWLGARPVQDHSTASRLPRTTGAVEPSLTQNPSQNPRPKTWFCAKPAKPDGRARRAPRSFRAWRASDPLRTPSSADIPGEAERRVRGPMEPVGRENDRVAVSAYSVDRRTRSIRSRRGRTTTTGSVPGGAVSHAFAKRMTNEGLQRPKEAIGAELLRCAAIPPKAN